MSDRTGLGPMEVAVLDAFRTCGATPDAPYQRTSNILDAVADQAGIPPRAGYQVVCDLSRAWAVHLRLVDFDGNHGTLDFGPAEARYTECRLTAFGAAAMRAERGEFGALPIGLVNGTTYVGGRRPPLDPERLVAALRAAAGGADDDEIVRTVGPPAFPTACRVRGELAALSRGETAELTLTASITLEGDDRLVLASLPPDVGASHVAEDLIHASAHELPAIVDVNDETTGLLGHSRIVVRLGAGSEPDAVIAELERRWGVRTTIEVAFGEPLPSVLRGWLRTHGSSDLDERLAVIEAALERERADRSRSAPVQEMGRTAVHGYRPI